jgi:hypothetical protein
MEIIGKVWNLLIRVFSEALDWALFNWIIGLVIIAFLVLWAGGLKKQK